MDYLKDGRLTEKGRFASNIYTEEIIIGEIFGTQFYKNLTEYQMLLLFACICYEARERTQFFERYTSKEMQDVRRKVAAHPVLHEDDRFKEMAKLTGLLHPCYNGATIFEIMNNTNLQEGDLVRFFRQVIDRITQVKMATTDRDLQAIMDNCQKKVLDCLKDIDAV